MSQNPPKVDGSALAGGLIAAAILDALKAKGVFSNDECRSILDKALRAIGPLGGDAERVAASQIIASLMRGNYSARG